MDSPAGVEREVGLGWKMGGIFGVWAPSLLCPERSVWPCRSLRSSAMSSSTHSHAGRGQFPGNCSLEKALQAVVDVFHQYSTRRGEMDLLSLSDFSTLLREQAPTFLGACVSDRDKTGTIPGHGAQGDGDPSWGPV